MKLSIIIVPYKCKDQLRVTLDAVLSSKVNFEYEIIVVDNDSQDGTVEMVEEYISQGSSLQQGRSLSGTGCTLIKNTNEGFSKGNNRGLKIAKGEYKLLLNSDTKVSPDTLQVMFDFMESHPQVGIATCQLVLSSGEIDKACVRGLPDPWNSLMRVTGLSFLFPKFKFTTGYNLTAKNLDEEMQIGSCSGAFMFINPICFQKIGLLDEQFFMYAEDIDYCKRGSDAGFKVWYYPKTVTTHFKGQSSRKNVGKASYEFHNAMWLYYKKHLAQNYPTPLNWLVRVGIWSRYVLQLAKNLLRREEYVSK